MWRNFGTSWHSGRVTTKKILTAMAAAGALSSTLLVSAPAASAAGNDAATVGGWYQDFLGRDSSDDPGSRYWTDQLRERSEESVLRELTRTVEYNEGELDDYYGAYLGRSPDPGSAYWLNGTTSGAFPLEWAEQNVLGSREYQEDYVTRPRLIFSWYSNVLGIESGEGTREITSGEFYYWSNRVSQIGTLGTLREMWYTPEAVSMRISDHYSQLLGRLPSEGEIGYWFDKEVQSDINVQVLIGSSPEYITRPAG